MHRFVSQGRFDLLYMQDKSVGRVHDGNDTRVLLYSRMIIINIKFNKALVFFRLKFLRVCLKIKARLTRKMSKFFSLKKCQYQMSFRVIKTAGITVSTVIKFSV